MAKLTDFIRSWGKKRYGGYELIEEIGRGGMSRTYKARNPKTGAICALKVLKPESIEVVDRFQRIFEADEGTIALGLDHPNVIKTFDYGRGRKDEYYIAMEFVEGPSLKRLIVVGSPRLRKNRFDLVLQIGRGLDYIHRQGLIHRDFCPKNVLCGRDGVAKIIDFGLTIPAGLPRHALFTRAGTASYMAPEQVRNQPVDARTDIYAYGVSAYEILTGTHPFPQSGGVGRRMQDQLNIEPVPLRQLDPELPAQMENVIQKCIAKAQDMRYKSMGDVLEDMQAAVRLALSGQGCEGSDARAERG